MVKSSDATTVREVEKIQQVPVWYSIVLPQNSTVPPANSTVKRKKSTVKEGIFNSKKKKINTAPS